MIEKQEPIEGEEIGNWKDTLLSILTRMEPDAFERLCQRPSRIWLHKGRGYPPMTLVHCLGRDRNKNLMILQAYSKSKNITSLIPYNSSQNSMSPSLWRRCGRKKATSAIQKACLASRLSSWPNSEIFNLAPEWRRDRWPEVMAIEFKISNCFTVTPLSRPRRIYGTSFLNYWGH